MQLWKINFTKSVYKFNNMVLRGFGFQLISDFGNGSSDIWYDIRNVDVTIEWFSFKILHDEFISQN